ncbi:MAG: zinc-binding dehydrogenase [Deltaproteobacteria bacterium]|nr:zinc-binding dehydrogenase [Deltaproteobacteria bacterium]
MKALVLKEYNHEMSLEEREDPVPGPSEIVLRVKACGVCGTDLKIVSGKIPPPIVTLPHTPGHEIAGEVVAVGSSVKNISIGQKGIVYFYVSCKDCEMCRTGRENVCFSIRRLGFELPGGFAEYVKMPVYNFCPVPEDLSLHEWAILPDALATSYHALKTMAEVKAGQDVLILGVGGLGIHAIQIAKLVGARVFAVARREEPLQLANEQGADFVINSSQEGSSKKVMELTQGRGVDVVIENVGSAQSMSWSLSCLKRRGRLVIVGYDPLNPYPLNPMEMHYNEWILCGSRVSTKQELLEVIDLVQRRRIKPVITKQMPWLEANKAIEELKGKKEIGRTVLTF